MEPASVTSAAMAAEAIQRADGAGADGPIAMSAPDRPASTPLRTGGAPVAPEWLPKHPQSASRPRPSRAIAPAVRITSSTSAATAPAVETAGTSNAPAVANSVTASPLTRAGVIGCRAPGPVRTRTSAAGSRSLATPARANTPATSPHAANPVAGTATTTPRVTAAAPSAATTQKIGPRPSIVCSSRASVS
jgi:hypothetical protein